MVNNNIKQDMGSSRAQMSEENFDNFLTDLGIEEDDLAQFLLAWKMRAKTLSVYEEPEFINGMRQLGFFTY